MRSATRWTRVAIDLSLGRHGLINAPHPRPSARLWRLAARAGTPLRCAGWTPSHPSFSHATHVFIPARSYRRGSNGGTRSRSSGVGDSVPKIIAAGAAKNAGAFFYFRRPGARKIRSGERLFRGFGKTRNASGVSLCLTRCAA